MNNPQHEQPLVVFKKPNYPKIFDIIESHKIDITYDRLQRKWQAGCRVDPGYRVEAESALGVTAVIEQLFENLGIQEEFWK